MKDTVHGKKMESLMWSMPSELELHQQDKERHQSGIHAPVPSWQTNLELHAEFVENYNI
jgi:inner membrane protein involved in colicin E2 resistance